MAANSVAGGGGGDLQPPEDGDYEGTGSCRVNPGGGAPAASGSHSPTTTSGSVGTPSSRSEAPATAASESTLVRSILAADANGDDAGSPSAPVSNKKKKRGARNVGADKTGRGLRQFSMRVCDKVESKGKTTYNEVADELVAEFAEPNGCFGSPDQQQQYDEKNIRRRVYDALNVLMAMDIISKDKKEIQWKGLPRTTLNDIEELKTERLTLKSKIDKKTAYLQELEDQHVGLQTLIERNKWLHYSGNGPSGGMPLPFIIVKTRPHATIEVEISEDMQLFHFDFNSTPFELHDDSYVLNALRSQDRDGTDDGNRHRSLTGEGVGESSTATGLFQVPQAVAVQPPTPSSLAATPLASSPIPGILRGRARHEHC